jgi:hypothetical protein
MAQTKFLIGRGELLTSEIPAPKSGAPKAEVYTLSEAQKELVPQIHSMNEQFATLPNDARPGSIVVARIAINPAFIAKSYFPRNLLRSAGLQTIGSRTIQLTPRKWSKKGAPSECYSNEIFAAGTTERFIEFERWSQTLVTLDPASTDFIRLESMAALASHERFPSYQVSTPSQFFEVAIHLLPDQDRDFVRAAFLKFASSVGVRTYESLSFFAGNLWFLPLEGDSTSVGRLAQFTLARIFRPMPTLRGLRPLSRSPQLQVACTLPTEQPHSSEPRVAILDGGMPAFHPLESHTLNSYKVLDEQAIDDPDGLDHGLAVTSAFLYGSITPSSQAERPYAPVNHIRILDGKTQSEDPLELYRTLGHIEQVLLARQYEFLNLSLGPDLPIDDSEVHAWTSVIDDLLSDGETFMTIAAGNNGERDQQLGFNRVQVPSDCVNAVAVGSANDSQDDWARASYSAVGPGRRPGVVKPDLLAFGGDASRRYFHVLQPGKKAALLPTQGTSFAAPLLLRSAVGVRAYLGREITPLAIKALLVHAARQLGHDKTEVGWGRIPTDVFDVITSPPGVARIVYQGELKPGKYLRALIPLPKTGLTGKVRLRATFCYSSPTDPQDASAYTRAGLDICFRPHSMKLKANKDTGKMKSNADSSSFFESKKFSTEDEQRALWGKWETTLHAEQSKLASSLSDPVFDIHYNARDSGGSATAADKIKYALVITVEADKHPELYNDILQSYASQLVPIQPKISIPIRS